MDIFKKAQELFKKEIDAEKSKNFIVCIMGQTGTGKSSLTNSLFGTSFKTDSVKPCTKEIQYAEASNNKGNKIIFYDLPGIGESDEADERYLNEYVQKIIESDVVLWTHHADNRSVKFDLDAQKKIISMLDESQKKMFMSKLTFILTKSDLITPPAWYLIKNGSQYFFIPDKETEEILNQKIVYYRDTFLKPFDKYIVSQAVNEYDDIEDITKYGFSVSENKEAILFNGFLDIEKMNFLIDKFPKYKNLFQRLNSNYNIIPCSSLFNYNLKKIVLAIMNKIEDSAIFRIENFLDTENLDKTDINKAKKLGNIVLYDLSKKETLYDLSKSSV